MTDLWLAIAHHLLAFGLIAMVASELSIAKPGLDGPGLKRLAGIDAGYGLSAALIIGVGLARVNWGGKGPDYYGENHWFWAKMAAFALAGLLSIPPTLAFLRWRKRARTDPAALPSPAEIARVRRFLVLELLVLLLVPVFAAVMARYTTAG
jgi:putative membrane protein